MLIGSLTRFSSNNDEDRDANSDDLMPKELFSYLEMHEYPEDQLRDLVKQLEKLYKKTVWQAYA